MQTFYLQLIVQSLLGTRIQGMLTQRPGPLALRLRLHVGTLWQLAVASMLLPPLPPRRFTSYLTKRHCAVLLLQAPSEPGSSCDIAVLGGRDAASTVEPQREGADGATCRR